jgi:hypothetical protein
VAQNYSFNRLTHEAEHLVGDGFSHFPRLDCVFSLALTRHGTIMRVSVTGQNLFVLDALEAVAAEESHLVNLFHSPSSFLPYDPTK